MPGVNGLSVILYPILPVVQGLDVQDTGKSTSKLYDVHLDILDTSIIQAFGFQIPSGQNTEWREPLAQQLEDTLAQSVSGKEKTPLQMYLLAHQSVACIWLCSLCTVYAWNIAWGATHDLI